MYSVYIEKCILCTLNIVYVYCVQCIEYALRQDYTLRALCEQLIVYLVPYTFRDNNKNKPIFTHQTITQQNQKARLTTKI